MYQVILSLLLVAVTCRCYLSLLLVAVTLSNCGLGCFAKSRDKAAENVVNQHGPLVRGVWLGVDLKRYRSVSFVTIAQCVLRFRPKASQGTAFWFFD